MGDDGLFPGFETRTRQIGDSSVFLRVGGEGPPLVLLHGFPQTGAIWATVAPTLARRFRLFVPDVPGYGRSRRPAGVAAGAKRAMAQTLIGVMAEEGVDRFALAGHDRGGRVGYRLAFDHPDRITRLSVLDILPTWVYWSALDRAFALKIYHWAFLAQPSPLPERLIGAAPTFYVDDKLARWSGRDDLSAFSPAALEEYRANAQDPTRLAAMCDDYRAGAEEDVAHDAAELAAGRKIAAPLQVLWGDAGIAQAARTPLDVWRDWAEQVEGQPIASGHFLPEENPDATAAALLSFFDIPT